MITASEVMRRTGETGPMPLLTLDEFFEGNTDEECIGPNQWGYGRPPIAELAARLREIDQREDVVWVRVQLHPETVEAPDAALTAEGIAVCTYAAEEVCTQWVLGFEADVFLGLADSYSEVPKVPDGTAIWSVVWD
ncbi:hypothetical protein [Streptomyces sp. NPDC049906]|uniref:hypothetical protein n=1 Tax=Streptomyces sp. NPDC049906 TaxID=3155656 RepID=UPI00341E0256